MIRSSVLELSEQILVACTWVYVILQVQLAQAVSVVWEISEQSKKALGGVHAGAGKKEGLKAL